MVSEDNLVNLYILFLMAPNASYSREKKKAIGSFYTPPVVSDFLAQLVTSNIPNDATLSCLDPAVGDGVLLHSLYKLPLRQQFYSFSGVDIDKNAIDAVTRSFDDLNARVVFKTTDALKPLGVKSYTAGWKKFLSIAKIDGFDVVVCNPPWGADLSSYRDLVGSFSCATGQFDIYDVFVELIVNLLKDNGIYGLILPDSIFSKEHLNSRKLLLEKTTITHIVKLGESFFPDVNSSVSIIVGRKANSLDSNVRCTHITPEQRNAILSGNVSLLSIEQNNHLDVPQDYMIQRGWDFVLDTTREDTILLAHLDRCSRIRTVSSSRRGVELSKRGNIWCCPTCHKWSPIPPSNKDAHCSHCGNVVPKDRLKLESIIIPASDNRLNSVPITIGEDIHRYSLKATKRIVLGYAGVNYKDNDLFKGEKVVVRKTGVGISAAIDFNNNYTNQVVYLLKSLDINTVPTELLMAVINSRIITYYLIKSKSVNQWQTHPYLTQDDLGGLPFPSLELEDEGRLKTKLVEVRLLVKKLQNNDNQKSFNATDAKVERIMADLFHIGRDDYRLIYRAIESAQQMIPFRCLLNISIQDIFG